MDAQNADHRDEEIKLLARDHAELAIATLAEVAGDQDAKSAARVMAAKVLLDRGFGAPERKVQQRTDVHIYDERQAHLSALQKLAALNQPLMIPDTSKDHPNVLDGEYTVVKPSGGSNGK